MDNTARELRKSQILRGILPLYSLNGQATRSADLAKAAGISEALLFKYFSNKAELHNHMEKILLDGVSEVQKAWVIRNQDNSARSLLRNIVNHILYGVPDPLHQASRLFLARSQIEGTEFAKNFLVKSFAVFIPMFQKALCVEFDSAFIAKLQPTLESRLWILHHSCFGNAFFSIHNCSLIKVSSDYLADTFFQSIEHDHNKIIAEKKSEMERF